MLPDRVPGPGWDAGNYHANGYAALLELNGLMIRKYQPWDVLSGNKSLSVGDIFKRTYLVTNENETGQTIRVEDELPDILSDFLYERLAESPNAQPPVQTLENNSSAPETVIIGGQQEPLRARNFSSFGVKRIAVPEEEITEYLTASFARQALLQLYYNHWDDRFGFQEEPPPRNYEAIVSEKDTLQRWLLTDVHLKYEAPILPGDIDTAKTRQWNPNIAAEWMSIAAYIQPNYVEYPRAERLDLLYTGFEDVFNKGYRSRGVNDFYQVAAAGKQKMAQHIVRNIEQELFEKWRQGGYSAREIGELLTALRKNLEERKTALETALTRANEDTLAYTDHIAGIRDEWSDLGLIKWQLKWKDLYGEYGDACRDLFRCMTEIAALNFALGLIPHILAAIAGLKESVNQVTARFEAGLEEFRKKTDARAKGEDARNFRNALVKYYDGGTVKSVAEKLTTHSDLQKDHTAAVRKALIDDRRLGGDLTFERFYERVASVDLLDLLEQTCLIQARMAHDRLIQSERERILGVQLIKRLRDEHGASDEKLGEFARNIIMPAKTYVRFDPIEPQVDPVFAGADLGKDSVQKAIFIKRPNPDDLGDFVGRLDRALRQIDVDVRPPEENHGRSHEISVLSVVSNFPLRYLEMVKLLKEKYQALVDNPSTSLVAKLELHTDDVTFGLPDLYIEKVQKDALPYLLLAEQLEIVKEEEDMNGETLFMARTGKGAHEEILRLAKTLRQSTEEMGHAAFLAIKTEVERKLADDYQHKNDKAQLQQKLDAKLETIKASLKGGGLNPEYEPFRQAVIKAEKILGVG